MRFAITVLMSVLIPAAPQTGPAVSTRPAGKVAGNPFFALDTATKDANHQSYESQARMLKELGYAGWGPSGSENVPEMLKALDAHGLEMFALYAYVNVDSDQPKYAPKLKDDIAALKGRKTIIWLLMLSKQHQPSSTDGDERAVAVIREVADTAKQAGIRVALYPHVGQYVARVEDAVRLARKVERRNVGVTFNLCHWLSLDHGKNMEPLMRLAMPHLFLVTINGADHEGGWDRLIRPLGRGDFDVCGFLRTLWTLGYDGPIGFQGYGIKGDVRETLKASMAAWRQYSESCRPSR